MRMTLTSLRPAVAALCAGLLLLGGCASFQNPLALPAGTSIADAQSRLGPPTGRHQVGGSTRLEYATGPFGRFTWMLDFDAQGRLARAEQVLTERRFNAIQAGMSAQELRAEIGRPGDIWRLERQKQTVWVYRFEGPFCLLFNVGIGDDGKVVDTGYTPDPRCEPPDPI